MAVTETGHLAAREIDSLYRHHGGDVYRYAYAVLGNHADAEDVTQTTFLNAYRALEQGVRPRKPSNWLLTIASNAIKQRFRQEQARPRQVELDDRHAGAEPDEESPSVGELLAALSKIPPQQRQAIVLREFEGRSYAEIAGILSVTTAALETLLFRARRSLAEELEQQLTCTEAQLAVSRAVDDRLGRKERRRLRKHLAECPDCARFARLQQRHRHALRGLLLVPIPLSFSLFKGLEGAGTATAATFSTAAGGGAVAAGAGFGGGAAVVGTTGGGALAGGVALKAAAVLAAAGLAGGVAVTGSSGPDANAPTHGKRYGQVAPRGVLVPGNGVARGKAEAPGQVRRTLTPAGSKAHRQQAAKARRESHTASSARRATQLGRQSKTHGASGDAHATHPRSSTHQRATGADRAPRSSRPAIEKALRSARAKPTRSKPTKAASKPTTAAS